jgi:hypothetical protein
MAEVLGYLTLQDKALPVGQDGTRIAQWEMRKGLTFEAFAGQVSSALAATNAAMAAKWGWLFYITDEIAFEYPNGGSVTPMTELTDVDNPAPIKGTTIGHMIDLHYYGEAVGGTWRYFRDVRPAQIEAEITAIVNRGIWRFEQKLLGRFFASTETAIGSSGYNVPFVHSTGGAVDFAPPSYDGSTFTTSHDHFIGYNASTMADVLEGLVATLAEHGHQPPYTALVSRTDSALFGALANKVVLVDTGAQVIRGGLTSGPTYYAEGTQTLERIGKYQSTLGQIDLIASARIPTGLVGLAKSYGNNNPQNPLYVRVHPQGGFGFSIIPSPSDHRFFPIQQVDVDLEFGVGVGRDRTNGAVGFLVAGGSYTDGTIS